MKIILAVFTLALISQLNAIPAADPAAAIQNATTNATDALAKATNASDVADQMSKLMQNGMGSMNPLKMANDFITSVNSALQDFFKSLFGMGSEMNALTNITNMLNPMTAAQNMSKNVVDDALKMITGGDQSANNSKSDTTNPITAAENMGKDMMEGAMKLFGA